MGAAALQHNAAHQIIARRKRDGTHVRARVGSVLNCLSVVGYSITDGPEIPDVQRIQAAHGNKSQEFCFPQLRDEHMYLYCKVHIAPSGACTLGGGQFHPATIDSLPEVIDLLLSIQVPTTFRPQ